ncbi:CHAD domain-containing protein, partial [Streptomyces sp. NPDC059477]|uniref:CHAD domain-containing protein n=1 Tax=Streptomyces sp. NPDC059477 TaxID=3346847 RepID=UPI0036B2AC20
MAQQHLDPTDPMAGAVTGEALAGYLRAQAMEFLRALRLHRETGTGAHGNGTEESVDAARALRRSARRISGSLHTFRPLLDPDWSEGMRPELAWLSGTLALEHAYESRLDRLLNALHRLSGSTPLPPQPAPAKPGTPTGSRATSTTTGSHPADVTASGRTTEAGGGSRGPDGATGSRATDVAGGSRATDAGGSGRGPDGAAAAATGSRATDVPLGSRAAHLAAGSRPTDLAAGSRAAHVAAGSRAAADKRVTPGERILDRGSVAGGGAPARA